MQNKDILQTTFTQKVLVDQGVAVIQSWLQATDKKAPFIHNSQLQKINSSLLVKKAKKKWTVHKTTTLALPKQKAKIRKTMVFVTKSLTKLNI